MPKYLLHFSLFFLLLTAITGVWMRLFVFTDKVHIIPYSHLLHGHSHGAILGWIFLATFIIFLHLSWENLKYKQQAIVILITTFIVTTLMFIAFLYQGYAVYSIILSTAHIFIEYWLAVFIFVWLKRNDVLPKLSKLFIKAALLMLVISSIGPFSLGATAAQGYRDSPFFDMAIYFYLHFQYNGWLYFMLIGLFIWILQKNSITLHERLLKQSFWIYFVALFPGFLLSILWYDFSFIAPILAMIGGIGQFIGVLLFVIALLKEKHHIKYFSKIIQLLIITSLSILFAKAMMELALIYPPLADIVYDTRSVVIGYLHLTFLGFISIFIFAQFGLVKIFDFSKKGLLFGISLFIIGFFFNEITLFASGLLEWVEMNSVPYHNELLLFASIILLSSVCVIWYTMTQKN